MTRRSTLVSMSLDGLGSIRAEFELWREAEFEAAQDETAGALLNARGRAAGVDAYSLFMGPRARAYAYASEELRDYWTRHPRPVFEEFERTTAEQFRDPERDRLASIIRRARAEAEQISDANAAHTLVVIEILEEL